MSEKDDNDRPSTDHIWVPRDTGFDFYPNSLKGSREDEVLKQALAQKKEEARKAKVDDLVKKYGRADEIGYDDRVFKALAKQDAELAEYEKKKQDLARWREGLRLEVQEIKRRKGIEEPKPKYTEPPKQVVPPPAASTGTGCVLVVLGVLGFIFAISLLPFFMKQLIALL